MRPGIAGTDEHILNIGNAVTVGVFGSYRG